MLHHFALGLLAAGFLGAGIFNALGKPGTRSDFARWGYPPWWHIFTGGVEVVSAGLIAFPATRLFGLALGAVIIVAAIVTVLRHREFGHLAPLGVFAVLLVAAGGF